MNKTISLVLVGILALSSIAYALILSNPYPNGNTLDGTTTTFSIDGDINMNNGWVLIDNGLGVDSYGMVCFGTVCTANIDLTSYNDMTTYNHYYFVDGKATPWYNFDIDRKPSKPTGFVASSYQESSLNLSWNKNQETDIAYYEVYKSNAPGVVIAPANLLATTTATSYLDTGLTLGNTYYYKLVVGDTLGQTEVSDEISGLVIDSVPPVEPTFNPISGSTVGTTTPAITITYADVQDVTLKIYSGNTLIKSYLPGLVFGFSPVLNNGTTYLFKMNAKDPFGNERNTSYSITTTDLADVGISVLDTLHMTTTATPIISSALPGGYILIKYSVSMYGGDYVRVKASDLSSAGWLIDIDADTQPIAFCGEDYDAVNMDIVALPTKNVYSVKNDYVETAGNALNCLDIDPTGETSYNIYLKAVIPVTAKAGDYASTIRLGMYSSP